MYANNEITSGRSLECAYIHTYNIQNSLYMVMLHFTNAIYYFYLIQKATQELIHLNIDMYICMYVGR